MSIKNTLFCFFLCVFAANTAQAQLPVNRTFQAAFDKNTRSKDGMPGAKYWQNHAAYDLQIKFDPQTRLVSGEETIVYTNQSPDTLKQIIFKLYPNIYKKGAQRLMTIDPEDINDGVQITKMVINDVAKPTDKLNIDGTNMLVGVKPLAPGQAVRFQISYNYTINKTSHIRTGEVDNGAWFMAYFFPRIAVYDDIDGWNRHPYLGNQEFYNDFCDFKVAVTVPKDYIVWGTGDLTNCAEVLTPEYCARISKAEKNDATIAIIDSIDLKKGNITVNRPENTFRFDAKNVIDIAMAISNHYLWNATSVMVDNTTKRRTRVDVVFNKEHHDFVEVIDFARKTVEGMSFQFPRWPFPYPHMTVFDGLDQMEYPMMANDNPIEDREEAIELTDHEIFHTMFPFYMGTNETKYGWMDEGWATIGEWLLTTYIDSSITDVYSIENYARFAGKELDLPIMTPTTQTFGAPLSVNSYPKPALAYLYVMDLLGEEAFYKGLHHYIRTWNGKHPIPYDFFNCMNVGSGVNMDWFWKRWFFEDGIPDLAIASVSNGKSSKTVLVESKGNKPVPIDLAVTYTDGSVERLHRTVAVWQNDVKLVKIKFKSKKTIQSVHLGGVRSVDSNKGDNDWKVK